MPRLFSMCSRLIFPWLRGVGQAHLLDLEVVKQRLTHAPDQVSAHAESGLRRALYDCTSVPLTPTGPEVRLIVATHPATNAAPAVGVERDGTALTNFLSAPFPLLRLQPQMCLICTCIAARSRPCWLMKTRSKRWIAGTPIPPVVRSLLKFWLNGFGTFDENWDNISLHLSCVRPNLLLRRKSKPP